MVLDVAIEFMTSLLVIDILFLFLGVELPVAHPFLQNDPLNPGKAEDIGQTYRVPSAGAADHQRVPRVNRVNLPRHCETFIIFFDHSSMGDALFFYC
jgi:hypothetical protein